MELKTKFMYSNDPRFVYKFIYKLSGYCYYANHYTKIIRNGEFLTLSRVLNGNGELINYNNDIQIYIGIFKNDVPYGTYVSIKCDPPYYQVDNNIYICNATKINYENIDPKVLQVKPSFGPKYEIKNKLFQTKGFTSKPFKLKECIFAQILVENGQLIKYTLINEPKYKGCYILDKEHKLYKDIFDDKWKKYEIHEFNENP